MSKKELFGIKIHQITFSPTGGTRYVCDIIPDGLRQSGMTDEQCQKLELCVGEKDLDFPIIDKHDLVLLAFPIFAGRVPALALVSHRIQSDCICRCCCRA